MRTFADELYLRVKTIRKRKRPTASYHEAYAVILEELQEFWEEVKLNPRMRSTTSSLHELLDIAASAWTIAEDLNLIDKGESNNEDPEHSETLKNLLDKMISEGRMEGPKQKGLEPVRVFEFDLTHVVNLRERLFPNDEA
jgi:hypothetical protein